MRESGDHGPFNSWDRTPYISDVGRLPDPSSPTGYSPAQGKPSVVPSLRHIRHNLVMAVYASQEAIDNDDGSAHYQTHDNFFVYGANGLKSDFAGQWNHHYNNLYAFIQNALFFYNVAYMDAFYNNSVVLTDVKGYPSDCILKQPFISVHDNSLYTENGTALVCGGNRTLQQWLNSGQSDDHGTTVSTWPNDESIINSGLKRIQIRVIKKLI